MGKVEKGMNDDNGVTLHSSLPTGEEGVEVLKDAVADRARIGWFSPQYTISPTVTLNPAVMKANRCIALDSQAPELDAYRVLRTQILQKTRETGGNTIMITSAVPGEGKTVTAINLSITLAREFQQTVLLMDCDLRNQAVHKYMGYESKGGVIDYLLNDRPMSELIVWPGVEKLTVVSGGRNMNESSELLGSQRMKELVEDLRTRYPSRYVIFDMPAILDGADALAFVPLVDHVVLTVREGSTAMQEVKRSIELLPPGKLLGMVMNRHAEKLPFNQKRDEKIV